MKLSFYAKPGYVLTVPGADRNSGQVANRVGRGAGMRAEKTPYTCDTDTYVGRDIVRVCRQDGAFAPLYAADQETADYTGLNYMEIVYDEEQGEWFPAPVVETAKKGK